MRVPPGMDAAGFVAGDFLFFIALLSGYSLDILRRVRCSFFLSLPSVKSYRDQERAYVRADCLARRGHQSILRSGPLRSARPLPQQ